MSGVKWKEEACESVGSGEILVKEWSLISYQMLSKLFRHDRYFNHYMHLLTTFLSLLSLGIYILRCPLTGSKHQQKQYHPWHKQRVIHKNRWRSGQAANDHKKYKQYTFTFMHLSKMTYSAFRIYIFFYQYVCSLGIEPTTFYTANAMLYLLLGGRAMCVCQSIMGNGVLGEWIKFRDGVPSGGAHWALQWVIVTIVSTCS